MKLNRLLTLWPPFEISTAVIVSGPYYIDETQVYMAGAFQSQCYLPGQQAASVYVAGVFTGEA